MDASTAPSELCQRIEASFLQPGLMQDPGAWRVRAGTGLCADEQTVSPVPKTH